MLCHTVLFLQAALLAGSGERRAIVRYILKEARGLFCFIGFVVCTDVVRTDLRCVGNAVFSS